MPNAGSDPPPPKASKTGLVIAGTLNVLVVLSVLVAIPISGRERDVDPIFLTAFFNQMETLGVLAFMACIAELMINSRRELPAGVKSAMIGSVLALTPMPIGFLLLKITAHFLGWHLH